MYICMVTNTHTHTPLPLSLAPQSYNLSVHVNMSSDTYFGESSTLERKMADFHRDIVQLSSSLSFGLPHSQEKLNTYLGER